VTTVFSLFLVHLALGILVTLPLVPQSAGPRFFKFCSAAAAFMLTAACLLLYRRLAALPGVEPRGTNADGPLVLILATSSLFTVLYNRAYHFSWRRGRAGLLAASLLSGALSLFAGGPAPHRALLLATDLTSILLLGAAASAMILGHYYLVVLDLPITALRRLTILLVAGLVLRAVVVGWALAGPVRGAYEDALLVARGLWSPDGVFVWMRLLFGIAGPMSLIWFIWKTVEIRSTQSATGILYVQLFLVLSGELLAKYLRVAAGLPL
jgi:protein NrfD